MKLGSALIMNSMAATFWMLVVSRFDAWNIYSVNKRNPTATLSAKRVTMKSTSV